VIEILGARGLTLDWPSISATARSGSTATLVRTFATGDACSRLAHRRDARRPYAQCVAAALGVDLVLHPEGERLIRTRFGAETTPFRLKMVEFPAGADIIPNAYNQIRILGARSSFRAGFPIMAWPMVESVLDTRYAHLHHRTPEAEAAIIVYGRPRARSRRSWSRSSRGTGG